MLSKNFNHHSKLSTHKLPFSSFSDFVENQLTRNIMLFPLNFQKTIKKFSIFLLYIINIFSRFLSTSTLFIPE